MTTAIYVRVSTDRQALAQAILCGYTLPDTRRHGSDPADEVCSMRQPVTKKYPAAFKERAVKLAVESEHSMAQTARDLDVHENTLHTWNRHPTLTLGIRRGEGFELLLVKKELVL